MLKLALFLQAATEDAGSRQSSMTGLAKPPANTGSEPESKDLKAAPGLSARKPRGVTGSRAARPQLREDAADRAADASLCLRPLLMPVTAGSCKHTGQV